MFGFKGLECQIRYQVNVFSSKAGLERLVMKKEKIRQLEASIQEHAIGIATLQLKL